MSGFVTLTDQMGRKVRVPRRPQRVISLVPSQTELLFDLGVGASVSGRTRFCIHPADAVREVAIVGGTKRFDFAAIERIQPDLIIGNKEENYREGIEQLSEQYPVWMSDIYGLADALEMIRQIGELVGRGEQASALAGQIESRFANLTPLDPPKRAAYLIWREPWIAAGSETFINDMLTRCGLVNGFDGRYPQVSADDLRAAGLDVLLLSSEPYPFKQKQRLELQALLPDVQVMLVDGELFSWYGSRLLKSVAYLQVVIGEIAAG